MSVGRRSPRLHTTIPATSVDAPIARAANREALVLCSSHLDATRTAASATTPYTTAVAMTAMFCLPNAAEPSGPCNAYLIRQHRLNPKLSAAPNIDA